VAQKKKTTNDKPRWFYRFQNYRKAFRLLSEAMQLAEERDLSSLEEEGVIQRFEYTWELAWNLLADILTADGVTLETRTPRAVIRAANTAKLIRNARSWMEALDARNRMAHTYDASVFEEVIVEIQTTYLSLFEALRQTAASRNPAK
jgi:nucleotidyltransferase substrate binding protein (TIGR01987 family)